MTLRTLCVLLSLTAFTLVPIYADTDSLYQKEDHGTPEEGFKINFNNVSIIEYIRFVSRITGINFVFDEGDLQFNVTIVSEEPISRKNIMSALVQILRIHNLFLLEQDNNILITSSNAVAQVPTLISPDLPDNQEGNAPIITRVFRLKNANPSSVAAVIRPMTSQTALLEVAPESKQLIITDVTTNVDKIAQLIATLDSPHSPLEIEIYTAMNMSLDHLIKMIQQLLGPFTEGNPLILVPQAETGKLFIVSTPYLIDRTLSVMKDLDLPSTAISGQTISSENIFTYKIQYRSHDEIEGGLENIGDELAKQNNPPNNLVQTLRGVRYIKDSNSLLFVGDTDSLAKTKEFLGELDVEPVGKGQQGFFLYKIQHSDHTQIELALNQIVDQLEEVKTPDKDLIQSLDSLKWIKETNSLIFTGNERSLARVREILPTVDVPAGGYQPESKSAFYIYKIKQTDHDQIMQALQKLVDNLEEAPAPDQVLISAIDSAKWIKETNSIMFTGDPKALAKIQEIVPELDTLPPGYVPNAKTTFYIYKIQRASAEQIEQSLQQMADHLEKEKTPDQGLINAIDSEKWIKQTNSLIFTGEEQSLKKLAEVLPTFDVITKEQAQVEETLSRNFYIYNPQYQTGDEIEARIRETGDNFRSSGLADPALLRTIDTMRWIPSTNSLLFTGDQKSLDHIQKIIQTIDIPNKEGQKPITVPQKTAFFIYKPEHKPAPDIETALNDIADDLNKSGLIDPQLLETIGTMRYVESSNSFIFTGTADSLDKMRALLKEIDVTAPEGAIIQHIGDLTFLIYKIQYVTPNQLMTSLRAVAGDLDKSGTIDKALIKTLQTMKWIPETNSILFTGPEQSLEKVENLVKKFDLPGLAKPSEMPIERESPATFIVYKPQYQSGEELISILCDFGHNLSQSGIADKGLYDAINNLKWIDKTSSLLISGDQASINKVVDLLHKFDVPGAAQAISPSISSVDNMSFLIYKLQYHKGEEIQGALKQIGADLVKSGTAANKTLVDAINTIQWIKMTNSLVATGEPDILNNLKYLIQDLDVPLRQVFIEVLVIETQVSNIQNFGVQWGGKLQFLKKVGAGTGNFPPQNASGAAADTSTPSFSNSLSNISATTTPSAPSNIPFISGFDLGVIGDIIMHKGKSFLSLGSLVNALQTDGDSTILLNPKIISQDGATSTIFVGQNLPFVGSVTTNTGANTAVTTNLEYRDIGFNLSITATLGNNNIVTLDISNDISEVINQGAGSTQVNTQTGQVNGIQTNHTSMNTRVHVPDQFFLVLSGMLQDTKSRNRAQIPCLGGIPVIGLAFSQNDRTISKSNVIFFIRPYIIKSFDEYRQVTEYQENLFKDEAGIPVLREYIEDGLEWVKTPNDD